MFRRLLLITCINPLDIILIGCFSCYTIPFVLSDWIVLYPILLTRSLMHSLSNPHDFSFVAMACPAIPQFLAVRDALVFVFTGADLASGSPSIIFYGKTGLL